ncbi:MAG: TlpA disulfide reductase family protein [Rikenellaceae bacterium]
MSFISCTSKPEVAEDMFLIKGNIKNVADSAVIQLFAPAGNGTSQLIAIDTIISGEFRFCDSIPEFREPLTLNCDSDGFTYGSINIWVDSKSYIEINGEDGILQTWNIVSDNQMQKEEKELLRYVRPVAEQGFELSKEFSRAILCVREKMRVGQDFKTEYQKVDSLRNLYESIWEEIGFKELEYLKEKPTFSEHWMFTYLPHAKFMKYKKNTDLVAKIKEIYSLIPEDKLSTSTGREITAYIYPPQIVDIEEYIPDVTLYDLDNKRRSISEIKDKYILLDFWSYACGPCVASLPELKEIAEIYKEKLSVVSISIDSEKAWREAVEKCQLDGYQWNELVDVPYLNASLNITGIPAYVLLSPNGVIKEKWSGYGRGSLKKKLESISLE